MREVALAVAGLVLGLAAARWSPHASIAALVVIGPILFFTDLTRRRLPETITIPWVAYEAACAIASLPFTLLGVIATVIVSGAGLAVVAAGVRERRALLGVGDVLAIAAVQLAFSDVRNFWPGTFTFIALGATLFAIILARVDPTRRSGTPFGGALAAIALSIGLPAILH